MEWNDIRSVIIACWFNTIDMTLAVVKDDADFTIELYKTILYALRFSYCMLQIISAILSKLLYLRS